MGLHFSQKQAKRFADVDLLHKMGCKLCPLYLTDAKCKDMPPTGSIKPEILILGQGPGREEDIRGMPFVGPSGTYLRSAFTQDQISKIRFNNITRTRAPDDREPVWEEIESCRFSIESDIELYKPKAVFAMGGLAVNWFLAQQNAPSINAWRGHRFPAEVRGHKFWVFPMFHPAYILRTYYLDEVFKLDVKNAYKFLARNIEPIIIAPSQIFENCYPLYTIADVKQALIKLYKEPRISVDLETTAGRPYEKGAKILSMSFGTKDFSISFPWKHSQSKWTPEQFVELRKLVLWFLKNKKQAKIAHNAAFEQEWLILEFDDPEIARCNWVDTMSSSYVLGYGGNVKSAEGGAEKLFKGLLSLDNLCRVHFGFWLKAASDLDRSNLDRMPLDKVLLYNCGDTKWDHALDEKLLADVKYDGLESIVAEHDRRIPTVVLTQRKGLAYSEERAKGHAAKLDIRISKIYNNIYADQSVIEFQSKFSKFNIGAPKDVVGFFKYLGYNVKKSDKEQTESSDDEILKVIDHPVARGILEYRELSKLKSTYVDIFVPNPKTYVVSPDGLIHGQFTTHFTSTGRLSSHDPNLQNFPKRKNKEIRDIIVAPPGYIFTSCDYGQLEYRGLVMASKDPILVKYVYSGKDIHSDWALKIAKALPSRVGGNEIVKRWSDSDITVLKDTDKLFKAFRDVVKNNWVFASFYGAGDKKLSTAMSLPMDLVKTYHELFWQEFAGVKGWHEWAYDFYAQHGYIETLTKRRRYAPLQGGEIINMPIQGVCADIVMDGMNRLSEYAMETKQPQFQSVIQIHDDLGFYLPLETWKQDLATIIKYMLDCKYPFINVPLAVEAAAGPDWASQKGIGTFVSGQEIVIP